MRRIHKVAVLGSGVMGTGIACHFANIGLEVLMLDILPREGSEEDYKKPAFRNSIANDALRKALKQKPAPLYLSEFADRIETGNFEDDFPRIAECDWVIEVVVERLDIKQKIFEQVDNHRKKGTLISSNTSGIPVHQLSKGRSEDFRNHFLGTHFFNPPRYLRLLEVIPTEDTHQEVIEFMMHYGELYLGKKTVLCKDTPAFIANRVGVYAMSYIFQLTKELGVNIWDADKLSGRALGRPKSGTFRLADVVGLDVAHHVIEGLKANCQDDEHIQALKEPEFFAHLVKKGWYGEKSGQGFYKKTSERDEKGRSIILGLNLEKLEYESKPGSNLQSLGLSKQIDDLPRRIKALFKADDAGGQLVRKSLAALFSYVSHRIPEISDHIYAIDQAMRAGFGWDMGPFEYWDIIGLENGINAAEDDGFTVAQWVKKMQSAGHDSFYKTEKDNPQCYDPVKSGYEDIPVSEGRIRLEYLRAKEPVFSNDETILHDIGDQVLCLEFNSTHNAIGEGILRGVQQSIEIAENGDWRGLVIGNEAENFTVGANLMLIGMLVFQEEWDELAMAVRLFQETSMRCRYSSIPVVAATQGYTFGGGTEIITHCDAVAAAAESYIGFVEPGIGVIPAGAGTKEFALRCSDRFFEGDVHIPTLIDTFKTIALAQVSTSAHEAFDYGYLLEAKDEVVVNTKLNLARARDLVMEMSEIYVQPIERDDIYVLGRKGLAALYSAAHSLYRGNYASEHDIKIAKKIAWVLCGGDLSEPQEVTEQYLLELEREAFLSLCGEQKTKERIQYMLEHNRPLRN